MYRPVSEVASETASVLCRIALWECFLGKNRNRTIAWWRNFATTTRILHIVVFFCKLGILLFKTSSWLTNLNKKAKTKWILVVVVKCRHYHESWTIANCKMIMSPKIPRISLKQPRPSKLTSGIFPSSTSFSIEVAQESAKLSKSWRSDSRGSQVLFILKKRKTELHDVDGKK